MNRYEFRLSYSLVVLLVHATGMQAISMGDIRSNLTDRFQPALQNVDRQGVTQDSLTKACGAIKSPGIAGYSNYFSEFYKPFVETFGGSPSAVCGNAATSKISDVNTALSAASPIRGGTYTPETVQAGLDQIRQYIKIGGSPFLFMAEWTDLIANLKIDTTAKAATPAPVVTQSSNANIGQDPNVVAIAQSAAQAEDTFLSADGTSVTDMALLAAKIRGFNNPNEDKSNPTSMFGLFDQQINIYYKATGPDAMFYPGYPNASDSQFSSWGDTILGMMKDVNQACIRLDDYTATGKTPITGFEWDGMNDSLDKGITSLVTAAQANGSAGSTVAGASGSANLATDSNLKIIAKALSGINGEVGKKDVYVTADGSVDITKLSNMATFATTLRTALDTWQGNDMNPYDSTEFNDTNAAAAIKLRYAQNNFKDYVTAMNNAVSDGTDIIDQLYGKDGTDGLFGLLGQAYGKPLAYDLNQTVSYNIYGGVDETGGTAQNPDGLVAMFDSLINEAAQNTTSTDTLTLDNADSIAYLATALADQIAAHNAAVATLEGRCGAMVKAFSEASNVTTTITLTDGKKIAVTGAVSGAPSTREVAEKVFKDAVDGNANNSMMVHFNNQATALKKHAEALVSAGATEFIPTDETDPLAGIDYFATKTITVGGSATSGSVNVTVDSYPLS